MTRKIGKKNLVMIASIFVVALFIGTAMTPATAEFAAASDNAEAEDNECLECSLAAAIAEELAAAEQAAEEEESSCEDCSIEAPEPVSDPAAEDQEDTADEFSEDSSAEEPASEGDEESKEEFAAISSIVNDDYKQESECKPCQLLAMFGSSADISDLTDEEQQILASALDILSEHSDFGSDLQGYVPASGDNSVQQTSAVMGMTLGEAMALTIQGMNTNGEEGCDDGLCEQIKNAAIQFVKTAVAGFLTKIVGPALAAALSALQSITFDDVKAAVTSIIERGLNSCAAVLSAVAGFISFLEGFVAAGYLSAEAVGIGLIVIWKGIKAVGSFVGTKLIGLVATAILVGETISVAIASGISAALGLLTLENLILVYLIVEVICEFINDEESNSNSASASAAATSMATYAATSSATVATTAVAGAIGMGKSTVGSMSL